MGIDVVCLLLCLSLVRSLFVPWFISMTMLSEAPRTVVHVTKWRTKQRFDRIRNTNTIWDAQSVQANALQHMRYVSVANVLFICLLCCLFVCVPHLSLSFIPPKMCAVSISIVYFVWLFGKPSCGETTLLNLPSEQANGYIHASKR